MARKSLDGHRDYLVREHRSGRTVADLAREFGVTTKVVVRILGDDYTPIGRSVNLPADEVVSMYSGGESVNAISKKFGVSRRAVDLVLLNNGITPRGRSEAELLKWSRMPDDKRQRQVAAAHDAVRGSTVSHDRLCRTATTRQARQTGTDIRYETVLGEMLRDRGLIDGVPQQAVGPYNCDIAFHPVAVEVWGGYWHFHGRHAERLDRRFRYILNRGWSILVLVLSDRFPLTSTVADYVVSYVQQARTDPSAVIGQYRVVWGASEYSVTGRADDDQITVIPPFTGRRNPTTGQYETIPR